MTLANAAILDALCVVVAIFFVGHSQRPAMSQPGVIYLIFHVGVISTRAWGLLAGAHGSLGLSEAESARALLFADLLLISLVCGWCIPVRVRPHSRTPAAVDSRAIFAVGLVAVPVGLYSLLNTAFLPGRDTEFVFKTSYQIFAVAWPSLVILAAIYRFGFRWYLVLGLAAYLALMGAQGYGRYRVVIPVLICVLMWLDMRKRRWPTPAIWGGLLIVVVVFIPMKNLAALAQEGKLSLTTAQDVVLSSTSMAIRGQNSEQAVFDQYAVSLTLSDQHPPGRGRHFLDLLALPIPRTVWPDKPGTAEHIREISTSARPLASIGAVVTLPGEIYYDYRLLGLVAAGLLFGRVSQWLYLSAYANNFGTVLHFGYLLLAASLIQVYRDGFVSIPVFLMVNSTPLVAIALLSVAMSRRRQKAQLAQMSALGDDRVRRSPKEARTTTKPSRGECDVRP